jgi:hypothetical protein
MTLRAGSDAWNGTVAWNTCTPLQDDGGKCGYTANNTREAAAPADGRMHYINYGKDVLQLGVTTEAEAGTFINGWGHITNTDLYWFTDPYQFPDTSSAPPYFPEAGDPISGSTVRRAANYGYVVEWTRYLDGLDGTAPTQRKPIWSTHEVSNPWGDGEGNTDPGVHRSITPAEQKASVIHGLIGGAQGILWFNHNFSSTPVVNHHSWRDTTNFGALATSVTTINTLIHDLAPVLNAPTITDRFTDGTDVRSMLKLYNDKVYVFSASTKVPEATSYGASFTISGIGSSTANVIGESRTVSVTSGSWSDTFADGNAWHIYEITL